jgi:hypothetical protein
LLERAGVSIDDFDEIIRNAASGAAPGRYFDARVDAARRETANAFVLIDMKSGVDEQDAAEGSSARRRQTRSSGKISRRGKKLIRSAAR